MVYIGRRKFLWLSEVVRWEIPRTLTEEEARKMALPPEKTMKRLGRRWHYANLNGTFYTDIFNMPQKDPRVGAWRPRPRTLVQLDKMAARILGHKITQAVVGELGDSLPLTAMAPETQAASTSLQVITPSVDANVVPNPMNP